MTALARRGPTVVALVAIMTVGSLGLLGSAAGGVPTMNGHVTAVYAPTPSPGAPAAPAGPAAPGPSSPNIAEAMAATAIAQTRAAGLGASGVFLPRPSATPQQVSATRENGTVTPLYNGSPAPMGLAYYGLSAGPGGAVVGTILNTTSLLGTVRMNDTGVEAGDLFQNAPDAYGIQLNAVATNVTLFGKAAYSFWAQNVVEYLPYSDYLVLYTNVWNFSGGPLSPNVFYRHGPDGVRVGTEYYGARLAIASPVLYPFTLTLWLNSTVTNGRDAVDFGVQLQSTDFPFEDFARTYDYVVFNSIRSHGASVTSPANFTANGRTFNAIGLPDDFELTFGGPGAGSQATLFDAYATLGLGYWDGTHYRSVPSAYSYGSETAETSTGANVAWSDAAASQPAPGLTTYGTMSTGPSVLTGLWNATAPEGSYPVTFDASPANAFEILTPVGWAANFTGNVSSIAPTFDTNTFDLVPGNYSVLTELSGYDPVTTGLDVTGPLTLTLTLAPDPATGVYTPLWAFSDSEVGSLAVAGQGTSGSPYLMPNVQPAPLSPVFGLYNDYGFPVYPAVFFLNTAATTEFVSPPSFVTLTNSSGEPAGWLPSTNEPQYWFWNSSFVGILNATQISGWFDQSTFFPAEFNTFNVIFFQGGEDLVANDTFDTGGGGLLVYAGGATFLPTLNLGGANDTVWGNTFEGMASCSTHPHPATASPVCNLTASSLELGLEIAGPNDLVYNNQFLTPTTAWLLPINLYSGGKEFFSDIFNVTPQPAYDVQTAAGFPNFALTGSIVGTTYEGGNFWWDYGLDVNPYNGAVNPYGALPYHENGSTYFAPSYGLFPAGYYYGSFIYPGGDFAPLVPYGLFPVAVQVSGIPSKTSWTMTVWNGSGDQVEHFASTNATHLVYLPNGTYTFHLLLTGTTYGLEVGSFNVSGNATEVPIPLYSLTWTETGLPKGHSYTVVLNGTVRELWAGMTTKFYVGNGTYPYLISGPAGYVVKNWGEVGTLTVQGAGLSLSLTFEKGSTNTLKFSEKGLPKRQVWCVVVESWRTCTPATSVAYPGLANGAYAYDVVRMTGQNITATVYGAPVPLQGTVDIAKNVVIALKYVYPYVVTFTESGLPSGGSWSVAVKGFPTEAAATGEPIAFSVPNGTYAYKILTVAGDSVTPSSGKVTVKGADRTVAAFAYAVTFVETGLPNGTSWCVKVGSGTECSSNSSIVFYEGTGTWKFQVGALKGYRLVGTPKQVKVKGAPVTVAVTYELS